MKIGIIIGRIGDVDGVALETEKWIEVLKKMGHEIFILSGHFKEDVIEPEKQKALRFLSFFSPECEQYESDFWANHIHRDDRDWVIKHCLEQSQSSKHYVFEYRMVKKDGGALWLRDFVSVDYLNGVPVTLKGVMFDISDIEQNRKKAENRSKRLESDTRSRPNRPDDPRS